MKPGPDPAPADAARWDDLTSEFLTKPGVTLERAFSRTSLMVGGKLFASAGHGGLLIKVSAARVAELIANEQGQPFSTGGGRVMREWVVAAPATDWRALAAESMAFVQATAAASAAASTRP
ncbi:MAG: hypothetical protein ABIP33_11175 [Pseudolysinimonas sp.]